MIRNKVVLAISTGTIFFALVTASQAQSRPSWCTSQPNLNAAERTICATRSLWDLDHSLNVAYQAALRRAGAKRGELQAAQARWLRGTRNACGANVSCLQGVYSDWIVTLGDLYK